MKCDGYTDMQVKMEYYRNWYRINRRQRLQLVEACKGAVAALSQNATFPADIEAAKSFLRAALVAAEEVQP